MGGLVQTIASGFPRLEPIILPIWRCILLQDMNQVRKHASGRPHSPCDQLYIRTADYAQCHIGDFDFRTACYLEAVRPDYFCSLH